MLWYCLRRTIRKSDFFQEISAPKKVLPLKKYLFGRSTCFEKEHVLNNYLFWIKNFSKTVSEKAVSKKSLNKEKLTLIHEIWLLLKNYNFL